MMNFCSVKLKQGLKMGDKTKRFVAILTKDIELQALLRQRPDLRGHPVAVLDTHGTRVRAVSEAAGKLGVRAGMTPSQATSIADDLFLWRTDLAVVKAACDALVDVAYSFSPLFEPRPPSCVLLDATGLRYSDGGLAAALIAACERHHLKVDLAIAPTIELALVVARASKGATLVPKGEERRILQEIPVEALMPDKAEAIEWLHDLGIRTIGSLLALPRDGLAHRFGPEVLELVDAVTGKIQSPLHPAPPPLSFQEKVVFDFPLQTLAQLLHLATPPIQNLVERLRQRGFAAEELHVELFLDPEGAHTLRLRPPYPTLEADDLIYLLRHSLEASPPREAVVGAAFIARHATPIPLQADLFAPDRTLSPSKLSGLLSRLYALVGEHRVGAPSLCGTRSSDRSTLVPYPTTPDRCQMTPPESPMNEETPCAVLRRFRPPVQVRMHNGRMQGPPPFSGRIRRATWRFRLAGPWWTTGSKDSEYMLVELENGLLLYLSRVHTDTQWQVEGVYG